jgi:cytochrome b6-f complex iron-sulfur subunit
VEVSPEQQGVTRRRFFNRALGTTFLALLGVLGLQFLAFLWPRLRGGFGADVVVSGVKDLLDEARNNDGTITPVFIPEARAYIVPAPDPLPEIYRGKSVVAGGLFAIWQRCVHLGCRVPWCQTSQGFECPCHGSKYSVIGEYFAGPAPRSLDRFVVEETDAGELLVKTGQIVQTPRLSQLNLPYPRGPFCVS